MATIKSGGNAAKPKGKPRGKGKPFVSGDARSNQNGQRSAAAVRTAAEYREYLIDVLHLKAGTRPPEDANYLQLLAYTRVRDAIADPKQCEDLLDRIWGKSVTPVEMSGTMKYEHTTTLTREEIAELSDADLARFERDALGVAVSSRK